MAAKVASFCLGRCLLPRPLVVVMSVLVVVVVVVAVVAHAD